jgi:phosphoenolpyruvate carboxylase
VPLDVAPLFESVGALDAAGDTLARLLADPIYRAHLAARGHDCLDPLLHARSGR